MSDYLSQVLRDDHHLDAFTCGKEPLDAWLKTQARRAQNAGTARTYVWTRPASVDVLAYYSIAPTQVVRSEIPRRLTGGYSVIPAYLLARLVLDNGLHGQGLGGQLLLDALARIVDAAFYRHHDFIPVSGSPRLYLKVSTAETVLAKAP